MKSFISFTYEAFGLFYAPKHTLENFSRHYRPSLLALGLALSLMARLADAIAQGIGGGWQVSTVFFAMAAGYLGSFMAVSLVLGVMGLFEERVASREFWGLYLASDFPLILLLPLSLAGSFAAPLQFLTFFVHLWSFILKLFLIQQILRTNFAKALILIISPILLLIFWMTANIYILIDVLGKNMMFF